MDEAEDADLLADLDPTSRLLLAEVDLGFQGRAFAQSDLGRHFIGCAHQEIQDATQQLARTWPWRRRRIQYLQNRIWRAEFLLSWLRELITSGKAAETTLHEREA